MNLVNTREFQRTALQFLRDGRYTKAPKHTKPWWEFWKEQERRCDQGYSVGDVHITGHHYFYLNFCQILRITDDDLIRLEHGGGAQKEFLFPAFWDGDYAFFWALEVARFGIRDPRDLSRTLHQGEKQRIFQDLGLPFNIQHLDGGKHLVVLKARGKGYSYKTGSILSQQFNLGTKSKNFAIASEREYLTRDGVLSKCWDNISFCNNYTAFRQPFLTDTQIHKIAGYKKVVQGTEVELGRKNEVMGVSTKNDPDKARGKRGDYLFFEEAGKFPGLLKAWQVARPSVEQGGFATGLMVAYGTGGTEEANYEGLETLFNHPDSYNCLAIENIWDEGGVNRSGGFFVPAWQNWEGFMDSDGNSFESAAREYHQNERGRVKQSPVPGALAQFVAENPFTPREATLNVTANSFPILELTAQRDWLEASGRWQTLVQRGRMVDSPDGLIFMPKNPGYNINKWPAMSSDDLNADVSIYESPWRNPDGTVPDGLYIACCDPYAHNQSTDSAPSLGAVYIIKLTNNFSYTLNECIVAWYVGRPGVQDDFNDQLFKLLRYYNAQLGFENDRGNIIDYARTNRYLHFLEPEFKLLFKKSLASSKVRRNYGMHMTPQRKEQGELYVRDWLNSKISSDDNKNEIKVLHTIMDIGLLNELIKYNPDGNFDRVSALMIGMYHQRENITKQVVAKAHASPLVELLERDLF
jgi:hypothetical protein